MGKSYAATKRDVKIFYIEKVSNLKDNDGKKYSYTDANWKLSRHPYKKKKLINDPFGRHTFGSPKHMNRLVEKKNKQMRRQIDRNKRRQEFRQILNENE